MASDLAQPVNRLTAQAEAGAPSQRTWTLDVVLGVVSIVTAASTYAVLSGVAGITPSGQMVVALIVANVTLAVILTGVIAWRLYNLSRTRGSGDAGAQLHVRMVTLFAGIAIVPTVLVALFAGVVMTMGINAWFSERVKLAITNAGDLAQGYAADQKYTISKDVQDIAFIMARDDVYTNLRYQPAEFRSQILNLMSARNIAIIALYDSRGSYVAGFQNTYMVGLDSPPTPDEFNRLELGSTVISSSAGGNRIQAMTQIGGANASFMLPYRYLLAVRYVDGKLLQGQQQAVDALREFERFEANRTGVQFALGAVYAVVGLLTLLAAVSLGLNAANRIVTPIGHLIGAAERVSSGDLSARVASRGLTGEMATLSGAFNRMTSELQSQQDELVEANRIAEDRRLFTEAVLSGVSAGVVGLDLLGRIDASNPTAAAFIGVQAPLLNGQQINDVAPELSALLAEARVNEAGRASGQLDIMRDGRTRNLSVRVTSELSEGKRTGFVVTFDDISDLVAAERSAAWGDIARRIAHEIKNPLTPIQLSAERLRRKYKREIVTDPDIFEQCTQTIIRQVGDIGRMVDEFSSFARMPQPSMNVEDAGELVRQAVFLQSVGNPDIAYEISTPDIMTEAVCDGRLISQALINVLKNASESVGARFGHDQVEGNQPKQTGGRISAVLSVVNDQALITVTDNGVGLPSRDRERLTEPYVTTRGRGTGLGLAIVKKIMEDHGGSLQITDADETGGAKVTLSFPLMQIPKEPGTVSL